MKRSPAHQLLVYALLITGAVAFTFPFIWMVSTSVKVDRELFSEDLKILPDTPLPMRQSPYIDPATFDSLTEGGVGIDELLPDLEQIVDATGFEIPPGIDRDFARTQIARGLYKRLGQRLPGDVWNSTADTPPNPDTILSLARTTIDAELVRQVFLEIHRYVALGSIRIRDTGVNLYELSPDVSPAERWEVLTPQTASLEDFNDQGKPAARLSYDFAAGDTVTLRGEFDSPIDTRSIRSIRLDFHPDDTWHDLTLTLESSGRRFVAERSRALANYDWATFNYQHASEDDHSTKLRTWIVLKDVGPGEITGPNRLRITLDLHRVNQATAWANKVKANYVRVTEQIPFWRYVRVSAFLVIANIVFTVISSSLAAYAFSRIVFPGRDFLFVLMLATMMIPAQVTMIPTFLIWKSLGAYNTLSPLWIGAAFGNAFFVFMLRQFMLGIPRDLEDAARIDGCGFLRIYWHVILPLIKPSLAAIAVMTFIGVWQDFLGPLIYIADQRLYSLSFGLYAFSVQVNNNPALTMAGSVLMTLPILAIFFAAQRYFIQGITLTGMKG